MMKVCVDAGHNYNAYNIGAHGCGLKEEIITWEIAERLRIRLERAGFYVVMTRPKLETNLGKNHATSLTERCKIANSWECDIFVSIHCNAGGGTGTETLIFKKGGYAESLAQAIQSRVVNALELRDRGIKERPELVVLKHTEMPAVLVETAFIDNNLDAYKLLNRQEDFAEAIFDGICDYAGLSENSRETETIREKAERIIVECTDTPERWIEKLDTEPHFDEFVCKIYKGYNVCGT